MIKFETKFDENTIKKLNNFSMKKSLWILIVCELLFVLLAVSSFLEGNNVMAVTYIIILVLYTAFLVWVYYASQKKYNSSFSLVSAQTTETYQFDEDTVIIETIKGEDYYSIVKAKYNYFYKVVETETTYFLYISKTQCHVLDKAGLVEGELKDLNDIFAKKQQDGLMIYQVSKSNV